MEAEGNRTNKKTGGNKSERNSLPLRLFPSQTTACQCKMENGVRNSYSSGCHTRKSSNEEVSREFSQFPYGACYGQISLMQLVENEYHAM